MAHRREPRWELVARVASDSLNAPAPHTAARRHPQCSQAYAVRLRGGALATPSAPSEGDPMHRTVTAIRRTIAAALAASRRLRYTALSGEVAALVAVGRLIPTGDLLDRLGAELSDGCRSWFGRHVAKAYRAAHLGADAIRVWAQHRTTGRWNHVNVYAPADPALYAGLASYGRTRHLVQAQFAEAA